MEESITNDQETSNENTIVENDVVNPVYEYLILTGHNDSTIKIWNENVHFGIIFSLNPIKKTLRKSITIMK